MGRRIPPAIKPYKGLVAAWKARHGSSGNLYDPPRKGRHTPPKTSTRHRADPKRKTMKRSYGTIKGKPYAVGGRGGVAWTGGRKPRYDPAPRNYRKKAKGILAWFGKHGQWLIAIPAFFISSMKGFIDHHWQAGDLRAWITNPSWLLKDFTYNLATVKPDLGAFLGNWVTQPFMVLGSALTGIGFLPIREIPNKPLFKKLGIACLIASALGALFDPPVKSSSTSTASRPSNPTNASSMYG